MSTEGAHQGPEAEQQSEKKAEVVSKPEVAESAEAQEFVDHLPAEASEKSAEDKKRSSGGAKAKKDDSAAQASGGLAPIQFPKHTVIKQQVQTALIKEENKLMKQAKKYSRKGDFFNLNKVLAKIREIRFVLYDLAKATYEVLKNLWLKYVHKTKVA